MIHRLMSLEKLESKSFPWPFSAADSATPDDTSGYDSRSRSNVTLAKAGPPDSQVNNTPFCHTSCQPGLPVAARPGTLPQRVKNANQLTARSEHLCEPRDCPSGRTDSCDHRSPAEPRQWVTSHMARSHTFREFAIRHLLIALQPRHVEAPQPAGMESNHLGYDSTAQSRQHPVAATRYPLSFIRQAALIQLSIISSLILVVKPDFRLRNLWCDHEFNLCHPLFKFQSFFF